MDAEIDALLAELTRFQCVDAAITSCNETPESLRKFDVAAPSPFVPEHVQIIANDDVDSPVARPFLLPSLPTRRADTATVHQETEQHFMRPLYALTGAGAANTALQVPHGSMLASGGSRLLPQVAMAPSRTQLVPTRENLVANPLRLSYEYRDVDVASGGGASSVLEGFSEAMKKQDEYAKQNIGKQPHAPGGNALTEQDGRASSTAHAASASVVVTPEARALNALVLSGDANADDEDDAVLARLVMKAPGLDDCLTLEDLQETKQATQAVVAAEQTQIPLAAVGANPTHLLRPYLEIVSDQDTLRAMQHSIADEKAFLAMQKTSADSGGSGMVALDELLHDLEDDEELKAMGFRLDDDDENDDDAEDDNEDNKNKNGDEEGTEEEPAATLEPEAEVELLLRDAHVSSSNAKRKSTKLSEWASMQSVDVRNFHEKVPEMAMQYGFELDTFQKECVIHLERHECVFVAAHTSAGKTVVAEYAIAMSQKHMTRTIYTSPIKALSNQKYRDFREKYGPQNVGLITGDVSLNPDASCLVMTTEILRSMLYRGADVIRDIEWVIFDEIHYINDSERGVVWEEVIIMLPEHVGMVFLSATTPNHLEFSDWIGRTKKKKIHVISTYKRPVPLQHYLYAGKELFKLFDAASGYNANAYGAAKTKLFPPSDKPVKGSATGRAGGGGSGRGGGAGGSGGASGRNMGRTSGGDQSDWTKLISSLKEKALLPVVVFAFSKRLCEESANKLNKLDLSTPSERSEIHLFLESSIQRLQGSDRELPQVLTMKEMLKRGIGVHHGGLLPIIKEMVEILFGRGLVKVLFSTETFAMGVNMPARTVVFNGIRKHDGKSFRDLLPGEYTQMAGRAGRRGLDSVGTVIIACWNDLPEPTSLQTMLAGKATMLSSQFRLTYNMILNLLRVEVLSVEDMMKRSFSEFHTQKALASKQVPQLIQRGKHLLKTLESSLTDEYPTLETSGELAQIHDFYDLKRQKRELEKKLVKWMLTNHAQAARAAIAPGRVVLVNVKGLPSDHFALVVRTQSAVSDADAGAGAARFSSKIGFEGMSSDTGASGSAAGTGTGGRARSLFKTITVVCLCPEDYEPPKTKTKTEDHVGSAFGALKRDAFSGSAGRLLKSKKDDDSMMMMMGRGKKSGGSGGGSASKLQLVHDDAEELQTNVKSSLLGKQYAVIDIPESCIDLISCEQAPTSSINVKNLVATSSKKELAAVVEFLVQLDKQSAQSKKAGVAFVDVLTELKVNDLEVATAYSAWQQLYAAVLTHACAAADSPSQSRVLTKVEKICKLKDYITRLTRELSNDSLSLFPDFQQRQGVLKKLGYISDDGVVQVKGRVACEINTCEEIVLTEMIFENVLANLEPEEIVAVLSALIFQEKTQNEPTLTPRLEHARDTVKQIAESLGVIQLEQHLEIDPAVYCKGALNFGLMEVVYEWARGKSFKDLCEITDVQEGSIVRCITRLDEVCREVRNAARVIGDPSLFRKMEVASEAIKRDVVFASSLYLS